VNAKTVGLIGLGLVGTALARRLLGAGFTVVGYDVDNGKRAQFAQSGGRTVHSVAAVARACERMLVAVFNTDQVEDVVEGADGVLAVAQSAGPRMVLSVSTCDPDRIAALASRAALRSVTLLEVPMSGASDQIARGDGVGLVAGERAAFDACADILDAVCPGRFFVGAPGNGARTKLAVNLILGLNRAAMAEGLVFAQQIGLDPATFLDVARGSAAYSQIMDIKGGKMVSGEFSAQGKIVQHLKDVHLMLEYARRAGQQLPLMTVVEDLLQGCVAHGEGERDNAAVIEEVRRRRR